jgi:DnaJ domain
MSFGEACEKCSCTKFFSSDPGLYDHHNWPPGWIARPSRKCVCGHKADLHTVYRPPPATSGALATYVDETGWRFAGIWAKTSNEEAEGDLRIYCIVELGVSDPVIRISGRNTYLAIAKASDGRLGWASDYVRATAERQAAKNCGDRKIPWVYSIYTRDGDEHNHLSGDSYCFGRAAKPPRPAAETSVQSPAPHFINYYTVLEVGQAATEDEIVESVLKLRRHWHVRSVKSTDPDARRFAEDRARSIGEAAEVLLDPAQRAIHDRAIAEYERRT